MKNFNLSHFTAKGSSRTYYPASGIRGGYDRYPDDHRPVSTIIGGGRRARCDPGVGGGGDGFRQVIIDPPSEARGGLLDTCDYDLTRVFVVAR